MARQSAAFRQVDLTRAVRGATKAGLNVTRVEIGPDGKIVLSAGKPAEEPANDLDKWLARRDAAEA